MKRIFISAFILIFSNNLFSNDINDETFFNIIKNIELNFSHFPTVNIWDRNQCVPNLDTTIKRNYRTIITNASTQEPNFDGKYRIVTFGTGSTSQNFFIIDLNNGNVYQGIGSTHGIRYELDSSLLIINDPEIVLKNWMGWDEDLPNWIFVEYILWDNNSYKSILRINPLIDDIISRPQ